jgi:hypothetical protein
LASGAGDPVSARRWFDGKIFQYAMATMGPVASAGTQFLLSLVLLKLLSATAFGSFSFLMVAAQLSWGVWSALFCSPLPAILARGGTADRATLLRTPFSANLIAAVGVAAIFAAMGLGVGLTGRSAALFAVFGAAAVLRWFARAHAYAIGTPLRTAASDLTYSVVLLACVPLILKLGDPTVALTWGAMLVATCAGFIPFGRAHVVAQFGRFSLAAARRYTAIWKEHSSWSLLGVISTEATANAHVYIVTALMGPTAFAPLAASALLIRPITVAMNALTDYERARMARQIGVGDIGAVVSSARFFRIVLMLVWIGTASVTALLFATKPGLVFPAHYARPFLMTGAALWMAVAAVRLMRMPESCMLQAGGAFRMLAWSSIVSCGWSIAAVLLFLLAAGPLWSILGILLGETVFAIWVWRQNRRWKGSLA